jgi:hypothetical protein
MSLSKMGTSCSQILLSTGGRNPPSVVQKLLGQMQNLVKSLEAAVHVGHGSEVRSGVGGITQELQQMMMTRSSHVASRQKFLLIRQTTLPVTTGVLAQVSIWVLLLRERFIRTLGPRQN